MIKESVGLFAKDLDPNPVTRLQSGNVEGKLGGPEHQTHDLTPCYAA